MDLLTRLITFFAENGYLAVFMALLVCGMGAPIPEDVTLVAGGVIAGLGYANVHVMFAVTMLGVLVGDAGMFLAGHHYGVRLLHKRPLKWVLTPKRYNAVQKQFERYGNRLLFTARFLPGMRTAVFVSAGLTHRVSFTRFLLLDGLAALISVPVWVYLGYFGANNHEWLLTWIHRGQTGLWIVLGALVVGIAIYVWRRRKRRHAAPGNVEDESA
ncbi:MULTISPECIES: DedA family protein [Oleiagrimonas]|uniref:DedA family protein n=1 Tax=Oleiagrimonas citrea TaxID=1665687 RepID=A0A846ZRB6_9GAMM|nr:MULTISPECIES: DedA family protein [Oleiagrimonas]NKZ39941.1 DedA family protein [Oleiagrimonas citrea]RAP56973.1 DedA family protein [Oleiagrimonas sp. MCCC 1A03011]